MKLWSLGGILTLVFFALISQTQVCGATSASGRPITGPVVDPTAPFASGAKYNPNVLRSLETNNPDQQALKEVYGDPNFVDCDQACFYQKANENVSLQYSYIRKKLTFLDSPLPKLSDATNDAQRDEIARVRERLIQEKNEVLGPFCRPGEDTAGDEPTNCMSRYAKTMDFFMLKIKSSLGTNEESESLLHGKQGAGYYTGTGFQKGDVWANRGVQKKGQEVYFSKSRDLGKFVPSEGDLRRALNQNLEALKPREEDFVKFKTIPRDPSDPSLGVFIVPADKINGRVQFDQEAYQAALAAWQIASGSAPTVKADLERMYSDPDFHKNREMQKAKFEKEFNGSVDPKGRSISRRIYDDARLGLVNEAGNFRQQQELKKNGNRSAGQVPASTRDNVKASFSQEVSFPGSLPGSLPGMKSTGEEDVQAYGSGRSSQHLRYTGDRIVGFDNEKFLTSQQKEELKRFMQEQQKSDPPRDPSQPH